MTYVPNHTRFAIGLDLSFKSPGCAIHDLHENKWYIYSFAKLVREKNIAGFTHSNVYVELLPRRPQGKGIDMEKYLHVEKHLMKALCQRVPEELRSAPYTCVFIEAYVFASREQSGHSYKLQESGGIIKRALHVAKFTNVGIITDSAWKCTVVGHGRASKIDTVHFISKNGPCTDMLKFVGYEESKLNPTKPGGPVEVPSPCQDLADASAIAMSIYTVRAKKPPKKRVKIVTTTTSLQKPQTDVVQKKTSFWAPMVDVDSTLSKKKHIPSSSITSFLLCKDNTTER